MTSKSPNFARSLSIQRDVIRALLMREVLTRYGRHNIGFLWLFVEPMIFTLGVTALWTLIKLNKLSSLPIAAFALTGYSTVLLWRNMPHRCVNALAPNASLMYHRNVRPGDIYISRVILEFAGATASLIVLSCIFIAMEIMKPPENVLIVAGAWFLTAWFGASLAILLGAWSERSELVEKFWHPAAYFLFPLAGAAFLVDSMPRGIQPILLWVPVVHCTEMLRDGYFGSMFTARYDVGYLIVCNLVLSVSAFMFERKASREFVPE